MATAVRLAPGGTSIAGAAARLSRMTREMDMLRRDPPPGVAAYPIHDNNIYHLNARKYTHYQTGFCAKEKRRKSS